MLYCIKGKKFKLEYRYLKDELPGLYTDSRKKFWFVWSLGNDGAWNYRGYVNTKRTAEEWIYKLAHRRTSNVSSSC